MGRLCAIDLGTKRIGIALSDEAKIIASPFQTIPYKGDEKLITAIQSLIREKNIEKMVIGLPLNQDGSESPGCFRARSFMQKLEAKGIFCELFDERYSSEAAEEVLYQFGKTRKSSKGKVDMIAAAVILKGYLETQNT
ncbi:MAG: Holliday junction resolvase RuvX [Spirochaetales bacterium]|nr:Holliday junction resolvase RuvX [Spirochaetales bacterium]